MAVPIPDLVLDSKLFVDPVCIPVLLQEVVIINMMVVIIVAFFIVCALTFIIIQELFIIRKKDLQDLDSLYLIMHLSVD